eukprot:673285-Alexandrium_andersonii.AAC.1
MGSERFSPHCSTAQMRGGGGNLSSRRACRTRGQGRKPFINGGPPRGTCRGDRARRRSTGR